MISAGRGAAGLGVVFPAMRNGTEDFGLGAGADDSFFLESAEEPVCSFCKDSRSSGKRRSIPGLRRDGFILSDLRHVNLGESSPKIKSYHCSFDGNDSSF